tara:strand:+ start:145 stop:456 length:312 start_codon:yes stop_codon:yes gene_type:complete
MAYTSQGLIGLGFEWEEDFTIVEYDGVGTLTWKSDSPQPSVSDCEAAHAEWVAQEYARNRQAEYPSINELIVALWENVVEERASAVVSLEAVRQAVKTKYPKP